MRAGPFAEKRIVKLLNRRFVNFFCNASAASHGGDAKASKWLKSTGTRAAYLCIFTPDGKLVYSGGATSLSKQDYFDLFTRLLKKYPQYNSLSKEEQAILDEANQNKTSLDAQWQAANLYDELGEYDNALKRYKIVAAPDGSASDVARASLAMSIIQRHQNEWKDSESNLQLAASLDGNGTMSLAADIAMEKAYVLLKDGKYQDLKVYLEKAIATYGTSKRIGEMHFYRGVACYFLDEKDWANYHWCWIIKRVPGDIHYMRSVVAIDAACGKWIYPNEELKYQGKGGMTFGTGVCMGAAMKDYKKIAKELSKSTE